jgi:hypothetical protein
MHGHCVIDNVFGILKKTFEEFLGKFELQLFMCVCILHNLLRLKGIFYV